ncbi:glucose-6-phosphate isomerase [Sphingorhabdus arenilitoris]|uniref:Glucose-6-phosphate isomerase n=1 Tax=Sphingorhabdus arenilitoris TaxID=1490041 RepID=A0ABV8RG05_9SPHN
MPQNIWNDIAAIPARNLAQNFAEDTGRVEKLTVRQSNILFDFSKTHLDDALMAAFEAASAKANLSEAREKLFSGSIVNPTEGRAAEHTAERGNGAAPQVEMAKALQARMRGLIEAIDAGAMGDVKHVLHIGIGGSALGPKLLIDALGREDSRYDVKIVSNVDAAALAEAVKYMDPHKTIVAVASKTFTTTETLMNAASAIEWMKGAGVEDAEGRVIALTASPDKAIEWGVDESRILPFNEAVGGRYSLWCSIGFPVAIGLGWAAYEELLEGAAAMDRHFRTSEFAVNAPVLAAWADLYYAQVKQCQTRAVFAYDERLRLLPDYLQQLEMESNGKSVTASGEPLPYNSAPVTWGGVGTDAQHAVFQLLHQGTHIIPVEFIVSKTPGHDFDPAHHETLLINCFAQGAALMTGRKSDDGARNYAGDRPSSTLLVDDVTPSVVGALIAFYEHRTYVNAVLLGINPFDQYGVELGKEIAKAIAQVGPSGFDPSTMALIAEAEL